MVNETDKCDACKKINQKLYSFSCNHKNCQQCLISNFVLSNLGGLQLNQILVTCQTCARGQLSIDINSMINLLNAPSSSSLLSVTQKNTEPNRQNQLCSKHSITVESFCRTCRLWLCSLCKEQYHTSYYPKHILASKEEDELYCPNHFETQFDTYCLQCQVAICKKCLLKSEAHFKHRHVPIEDKPKAKKSNTVLMNYQSNNEFISFIEDNERSFFEKLENDYIIQKQKLVELVNNLQLLFDEYSNQLQIFQKDMKNLFSLIKLSYNSYFNLFEATNSNSKKAFAFSKYITDIALISRKTIDYDNMNFVLINSNKDKMDKLFDYKIIWNNNEIIQKEKMECHKEGITHILELKKYKGFATCSSDSSIKIWKYSQDNINNDQGKINQNQLQDSVNIPLKTSSLQLSQTLTGHKSSIWALIECKDETLISGSSDKSIKLWTVNAGINTNNLLGHTHTVYALSELYNHLIASGSEDKTIRIWNRKDLKCISILSGHIGKITSLTVLLDDCLISGSDDNTLMLWNISEGVSSGKLVGHSCTVWCSLAFDDGITLASGSSDNSIKLWDLNQLKCIATFEGHENTISHLLLLKIGYLASVSWDASIKFWDLNTNFCVFSIKVHKDIIWDIIETSDGKIVTASNDKSIIIWESK